MSPPAPTEAFGRRAFLRGALATLLLPLVPALRPERAFAAPLSDTTLRLLETSPFVYVSPLRADGAESTCHAEVWFAFLDGAVVLITAKTGWKARSVAAGRDRARLWVGDHGRWKGITGRNEDFRQAPHFDARVRRIEDAAALERLLAAYAKKYPAEIETWRPRFRDGFASGERWLLRYEPVAG